MSNQYTKEELKNIFYNALENFNEYFDTDISKSNIKIEFFNLNNAQIVYESFCKNYFPSFLREDYTSEDFFIDTAASAFFSESYYGVLIREDIDFNPNELLLTFQHEISHIYCSTNEIPEGNFFDKYCNGSTEYDGEINAGYAIWREMIADYMSCHISDFLIISLDNPDLLAYISDLYSEISFQNKDSKKIVSIILAYIMSSIEIQSVNDWCDANSIIIEYFPFFNDNMLEIIEFVFCNLKNKEYWKITPELMIQIGFSYISLLVSMFV